MTKPLTLDVPEQLTVTDPRLGQPPVLDSLGACGKGRAILQDSRSIRAGSRSALERFVDSFFHERNIKWMLIVGAAIVVGSSLMLVTREWSTWPSAIKYLTILGYTTAIFGFAEFGGKRLGLKTTSKVLQLLTLLLIPVCYLSLSWLSSGSAAQTTFVAAEVIGLMIPATTLMWFAANRIFDSLLRGRQRTFVFSYMLLSAAGALPVISNVALAVLCSILLWMVMTAGVVKVNRHVFWITEEHRLPRIFAFFPIALLGGQFLILVGTKTLQPIPVEWKGFLSLTVASTVLLTARTVANVFRQRTGNLVRPLPWNIVLPLMVGLVVVAFGVCVSFFGFSYVGTSTYAAVPTCGIAAVLLTLIAIDTRKSVFVWIALILTALAYQCTPTLISDLVQQLKAGAAQAIDEQRLPLAFYGLTYLPLLVSLAIASRWCAGRKRLEFSQPMQAFVTTLSLVLFAVSVTHLKAVFLVSLVNIVWFMVLAVLFRDRRYVIPALMASVMATATFVPCGNAMGWFQLDIAHIATSLAVLAVVLTATRGIDRALNSIPLLTVNKDDLLETRAGKPRLLGRGTGMVLACLLSIYWTVFAYLDWANPLSDVQTIQLVLLLIIFAINTIRTRFYLSGASFWMLVGIALADRLVAVQLPWETLVNIGSITTVLITLLGYSVLQGFGKVERSLASWFELRRTLGTNINGNWRRRTQQIVESFGVPLCDLSLIVLMGLIVCQHLPNIFQSNAFLNPMQLPMATSLVVLWVTVSALIFRNKALAIAAGVMNPLFASALMITLVPQFISYETLPLIWVGFAALSILICNGFSLPRDQAWHHANGIWILGMLLISCASFSITFRIVAAIGLVVLVVDKRSQFDDLVRAFVAIFANIQFLLLVCYLGGFEGSIVQGFSMANWISIVPFLLPVLALSVAVFDRRWQGFHSTAMLTWSSTLRLVLCIGFFVELTNSSFTQQQMILVASAFLVAAVTEFCQAVRRQVEGHVWTSIAIMATFVVWLAVHEVIVVGAGFSQLAIIGMAAMALFVGSRMSRHSRYAIAARPLFCIGIAGPCVVTVLAIARELSDAEVVWRGLNSLSLLSAAGIYFYQGLVRQQRRYVIAAGVICNITLMLTWRSLGFFDLQLYLVPVGLSVLGLTELLKKELPLKTHEPLRYVGALIILVSPVFNILGGSWLHLFTLMLLSVLVVLLSIGLRLRALVYTGTAFLLADLVAMVIHSTVDHPSLLWVCGLGIGISVIAFAAVCENHRENLLRRVRMLTVELASWR